MHNNALFVQTSERPGEIHRGLLATAQSGNFNRLRVAVAYATTAGCRLVAESFNSRLSRWRRMRKDWLISIDFGITEPHALEFLANLPNSEVRIPNAAMTIAAHLRPSRRFHQKLYFFEDSPALNAVGLFSGSANLTVGGLYLNDEQATSDMWLPPISRADRKDIKEVMQQKAAVDQAFMSATVLDEQLLNRYRDLWAPGQLHENTGLVERLIEPAPELPLAGTGDNRPSSLVLASAAFLWVEVRYVVENLGPGRPGNQIDLQRGTRVFFGLGVGTVPTNTPLGTVRISAGGELVDCNMRFGNNQMDKLNLPIPGVETPATYGNQTLLFRRRPDGTYDLSVGTQEDVAEWKARSTAQASIYEMRGGREYGVFN
jgi:HKD family nuclease